MLIKEMAAAHNCAAALAFYFVLCSTVFLRRAAHSLIKSSGDVTTDVIPSPIILPYIEFLL